MADGSRLFQESQRLPMRRAAIAMALPPCGMLALLIWQVVLGHPWGKQPVSNASIVGWTIFLWLIYFRLLTVRLFTEVRDGQLLVAMRGFWRKRRVSLSDIQSVEVITYDPLRDFGGYGIRYTRSATAYIADGNRGVRLKLLSGPTLVIGSQKPNELADALKTSAKQAPFRASSK